MLKCKRQKIINGKPLDEATKKIISDINRYKLVDIKKGS